MEQFQGVSSQRAVAQVLELFLCGADIERLRLFDEGTDNVRLFAGIEVFADKRMGVVALAGLIPARLDRLPPWRHLIDGRDFAVAVYGKSESAGNRRSGHHEEVGIEALLAKFGPLEDTEAVLLIDDGRPRRGISMPSESAWVR
jgi:hypothetical protein